MVPYKIVAVSAVSCEINLIAVQVYESVMTAAELQSAHADVLPLHNRIIG